MTSPLGGLVMGEDRRESSRDAVSDNGLAFLSLFFSDIVGSTELRAKFGDARADGWHTEIERLSREAVERFRGVVVKGLGDGLMATFRVPTEALNAAIALQHALARRNRGIDVDLQVRVGITMGEVDVIDNDVFGYPVNEASRLCAAAGPGEILVGELASTSARRSEVEFGAPIMVQVTPSAPPAVARPAVFSALAPSLTPLPNSLENVTRAGPFVGRLRELQTLMKVWRASLEGTTSLAVLTGEAGLGKTTLLGQFAHEIGDDAAIVLYGRCDERTSAPYQPIADAVAHFFELCPQSDLKEFVGSLGSELVRLVPRLEERMEIDVVSSTSDLESERWHLQDAVVTLVRKLTTSSPVLLVIDDLHWAGSTSIDLIDRLLRTTSHERLMIVLALRPWDPATDPQVGQLLADRHRLVQPITDVNLTGLDRAEVGELAARWRQRDDVEADQVEELWTMTTGNPLFISQVLRSIGENEVLSSHLPQSVVDVMERQLNRHDPKTLELLRAAALIGQRFELRVAIGAAQVTRSDALESMDEATDAGVVLVLEGAPLRYEFAHGLARKTLESQLSAGRRRDLHSRIARELEVSPGIEPEERIRRLAFHWFEAGEFGDPRKGVRAGCDAAALAIHHLAIPEATEWLDRAELLVLLDPEPGLTTELAVLRAEVAALGGSLEASGLQALAVQAASALGDAALMARAALAHSRGYFSSYGRADEARISALRAALEVTPEDNRATRVVLMSRLANELTFDDAHGQRFQLVDDALAMARALGDREILAKVLSHRQYVLGGPEYSEIRLREGLEMAALATVTNDLFLETSSRRLLCATATERADVGLLDECLKRLSELADLVDLPATRWEFSSVRASRALLAGALQEASGLVKSSFALGMAAGQLDAFIFAGAQLMHLNYLRGRLAKSMDAFLSATPPEVTEPLVSWVARQLHLVGRKDEAFEWWHRSQDIGLEAQITVGVNAGLVLNSWAYMASVSEFDASLVAELEQRLAPYGERLFNQLAPEQPGHHYLALLADARGDRVRADEHFYAAYALLERIEAPVMGAITLVAWARSLRARGETTRARDHAAAALRVARDAGASQIEFDAAALLEGDQ